MTDTPPKARPQVWSWGRRILRFLGSLIAAVSVTFFGLVFALLPAEPFASGWHLWFHGAGVLGALVTGASMFWRTKAPSTVLLINGWGSVLLPLDPLGPAIALTWVLAKSPRRAQYWAIPLGAAGIAVPFVRDYQATPEGTVFSASEADSGIAVMSASTYVVVAAALTAAALAVGYARRWERDAARAATEAQRHSDEAVQLQGALTRQEERELIAREMHDTVAHHLSLVSLHAAALEVTSTDPAVPQSAKAVRNSAHQALEEMRTLVHSLRDSNADGYAGITPSLQDIESLVEETRAAGVGINANLRIGAAAPPPPVCRAAYRIVQEALTNARRHAPSSGIGVEVIAGPVSGIHIAVTNWLPGPTGPPAAHGSGILGMTERAVTLGGWFVAGPRADQWLVQSWLPWEGK